VLPLLLAVILVVVAGCSMKSLFGEDHPAAANRCTAVLSDPPATAKPSSTTVLLADGSASSFDRSGSGQRDDWAGALAAHLPSNGTDLVAIGLFGGAVDWRANKLTAGRSTDTARTQNDLKDARNCLTADLTDAMKAVPSKPQSDILRALAEGTEYVRKWPGDKSIYLATDGLSNTGCADLRAASIGDETAIKDIVKGCGQELPILDRSFTVHFIGVGNAAAGWSDIKTPQRTWITDLWKALCDATKAICDKPDSAKPNTIDTPGVKPPGDSDVSMPNITVKNENPTVISVPSSLLFDTDSYQLAPGRSQDSLQQVYDFLKPLHPKRIEVDGFTDSRGTPEHNQVLSEKRAEAVATKLSTQGFTNVTTHGYASDRPKCTPEYGNDGNPDPIAMACNRRVEIVVFT
jgi:outer membrane protein OmpA-like peptidoglycan-associated protein